VVDDHGAVPVTSLRAAARGLVFVVVVSVATAALLEGLLASLIVLRAPAWLPASLRDTVRTLYMEGRTTPQGEPGLARYDPELVYTLRPGVARFANREFDTQLAVNSRGLRDDEASLVAPEVIVLGDSFAMGWGVAEEESFPALIERESGLRVLNAAVPSYGTVREMRMLDRLDTSRLRYLVIQFSGNDAFENYEFLEANNHYAGQPPEAYAAYVDEYRREKRYFPGKYAAWVLQDLAERVLGIAEDRLRRLLRRPKAPPVDQSLDGTDYFINAALNATRVDLRGVRLIVFEVNQYGEHASELIAELRPRLRSGLYPAYLREARLIDLYPLLDARHFFSLDDHLNAAGHRVIAAAVLAAMKADRP
jgi:lysophospholipase L1-like esterase